MSLLKLNIPVLDDELKGLTSGSLIVIEGSPLSYFELIARYILVNQAYAGGRVAYFLIDEDVEDARESMSSLGLKVQALEASGAWLFLSRSRASLQENLDYLLALMKEGLFTCIDTFSSLINEACHDKKQALELLSQLKSASRSGGLHILLTIPTMHDLKLLNMIRDKADVVMKVSYRESGNSFVRYLKVVKVKRRPHQGVIVPFSITRTGLLFETVTRIA